MSHHANGTISIKKAKPNQGIAVSIPQRFNDQADSGVSNTPPIDKPVEAMDNATDLLGPGNQRVTNVVATTIDTPLLPAPNNA